jgi:hypothetical protein
VHRGLPCARGSCDLSLGHADARQGVVRGAPVSDICELDHDRPELLGLVLRPALVSESLPVSLLERDGQVQHGVLERRADAVRPVACFLVLVHARDDTPLVDRVNTLDTRPRPCTLEP